MDSKLYETKKNGVWRFCWNFRFGIMVNTVTDPSDQGVISTNYQWLPENYIIHRLFPVPFSNTYDDSFLVLGIGSVFRGVKFLFVFLFFLFMCRCLFSTAL